MFIFEPCLFSNGRLLSREYGTQPQKVGQGRGFLYSSITWITWFLPCSFLSFWWLVFCQNILYGPLGTLSNGWLILAIKGIKIWPLPTLLGGHFEKACSYALLRKYSKKQTINLPLRFHGFLKIFSPRKQCTVENIVIAIASRKVAIIWKSIKVTCSSLKISKSSTFTAAFIWLQS